MKPKPETPTAKPISSIKFHSKLSKIFCLCIGERLLAGHWILPVKLLYYSRSNDNSSMPKTIASNLEKKRTRATKIREKATRKGYLSWRGSPTLQNSRKSATVYLSAFDISPHFVISPLLLEQKKPLKSKAKGRDREIGRKEYECVLLQINCKKMLPKTPINYYAVNWNLCDWRMGEERKKERRATIYCSVQCHKQISLKIQRTKMIVVKKETERVVYPVSGSIFIDSCWFRV